MIDIGSEESKEGKLLSNFTEHHFYIDGVFCASMEGFLQSLKFDHIEKQHEICSLVGVKAKFKGKKKKWYLTQTLYWQGKSIDRHSEEYQKLLDRAFSELFKNKQYKLLLLSTEGNILIHSIGKNDPKLTILTTDEFCLRLMLLRDYIK
jgi:predicted NAD-dependent protein-ADP-ribosyltransferase YbiA (DUF1768 family)